MWGSRSLPTAQTLIITCEKTNISRQNAPFQAFLPADPAASPRKSVSGRRRGPSLRHAYFSRFTVMLGGGYFSRFTVMLGGGYFSRFTVTLGGGYFSRFTLMFL